MNSRYSELVDQFKAFHEAHPEVWELFQQFAFEKIGQGFKHYSANGIFERIRWEVSRPPPHPADFKLNNNYRSFYSRRFHLKYPGHDGFFRTREQTSNYAPATNLPPLGPRDFPRQPGART